MAKKLESRAADVSRLVDELDRSLEDERRHISRELHDELGQLLTGLRIELALAQARVDDPQALRSRLQRLDQHLELALEALSRIVRGLRPHAVDDLGLIEASQSLVKAFSRRSRIPCKLAIDLPSSGQPLGLDGEEATQVYRILQESLTNVTRHANATSVDVSLAASDGRLCLSIRDDGKGFEPGGSQAIARHGLIGMRERAQSLGGALTIESAPGAGTTVRLEVRLRPSN
jgi:signal transduction histidine kinase